MNEAIVRMLASYKLTTNNDYENALKEILQEIALLGLWRAKFFEKALFYGGSALRILYKLDRFSEDLDFSLKRKDLNFDLSKYFNAIKAELQSFGFTSTIESKVKSNNSTIESAFIKAGTIENMINVQVPVQVLKKFHRNSKLKIKFEIDIDPPSNFIEETKFLYRPIPFSVNTMTQEDLFAGKMHCVLFREWKKRIKGRDWYDLVWFVCNNISLRLAYLKSKSKESGHIKKDEAFNKEEVIILLVKKIQLLDFERAKEDVLMFIKDADSIKIWSKDFFMDLVTKISFI